MPTIQEAVNEIKLVLEKTIIEKGAAGKHSLIRSQKLIKLIHAAVKSQLIANEVAPEQIGQEKKLSGFLKPKSQDVVVFPRNSNPVRETIETGFLEGKIDDYGKDYTERTLSINVRSQLTSLDNNFDTLYERTFAEAFNLHLRCPGMCLGEVYMIPVYEYNIKDIQNNTISFSPSFVKVEKYLLASNAINGRIAVTSDHHKYEQVCLLIVDFSQAIPRIYSSDEELKNDGLLPENSIASITNLTFQNFVPSILETYRARFPNLL
jgi:hypothetical protein